MHLILRMNVFNVLYIVINIVHFQMILLIVINVLLDILNFRMQFFVQNVVHHV
jgi:hypothetical protein